VQAERLLFESGLSGFSPSALVARGAFGPKSAASALERLAQMGRALLFDRDARLYTHKDLLGGLEKRIVARLSAHAKEQRLDPSIAREELRQRVGSPPPRLFAKALAELQERGELHADAERVRPPGVAAQLDGPDADVQENLARLLEEGGLAPPRVDELPQLIGESPQQTQGLLKSLQQKGRAQRVSEELWFSARALHELKARLRKWLDEKGSIDAQGMKELTGQSRKFIIPLLEYFDRERVTLRVGDKRVARKER
jgi:selenocysteine-specific elongation factor